MAKKGTVVMEHNRIAHTIQRFAHRIVEDHHKEKKIVLLGVRDNGYLIAERILSHLSAISSIEVELVGVELNKLDPLKREMVFDTDAAVMKGRNVMLIDDVLNSGRTLVHTLSEVLRHRAKQVNTFVLVDRIHRSFPVKADHVGMSLSTTLQERVEVNFSGKEDYAYLI